jgi:branched-chain amino acid transport system permease protein
MRRFHFHPCGNFKASYKEELAIFETDFGRLWVAIALILVFGLIPFVGNAAALKVLNMIGIFSIAAIGLNILTGYTGMISLGHSAIFGIGAYTAAILSTSMNVPFWIAIPAGGVISSIIGIGFGLPAIRLMGFYLCFATLACQKIMEFIFIYWKDLTGGAEGILISRTGFLWIDIKNDIIFYYVIFISLVLLTWMAVNFMHSKYGRAFTAIRDNHDIAEAMGMPASKYKLLSFAISSFYAGFAGALFAYYNLNVSPGPFNLSFSIILIAMVIIGGLGSIPGSIFGATIVVILKEALTYADSLLAGPFTLHGVSFTLSSLYEFAIGLLIALFIIFKPKGMADVWRDIRCVFRSWPLSKGFQHGFKRSYPPHK